MPAIDMGMRAICRIPYSLGCIPCSFIDIPASRNNTRAVGGPGHSQHSIGVTVIGVEAPAICRIPHLHCMVITPRGKPRAVGGPRHRVDMIGVPAIGVEAPAIYRIPHLHCEVSTSRGYARAVGGPGNRIDTTNMPVVDID